MPLYARDLLMSERVQRMSPAQRGVYLILLAWSWVNDGLPNDTRALAVAAMCDRSEFDQLWTEPLCSAFELGKDGRLRNARQEEVRSEQQGKAERRAAAGAKGSAARWQAHSGRDGNRIGDRNSPSMQSTEYRVQKKQQEQECLPVREPKAATEVSRASQKRVRGGELFDPGRAEQLKVRDGDHAALIDFHAEEYRWLKGSTYPFFKRDAKQVKQVLDACKRDLDLARRVVLAAEKDAWIRDDNGMRWGAIVTKLPALLAAAGASGEDPHVSAARDIFRTCDTVRWDRLRSPVREIIRDLLREQFRCTDGELVEKIGLERVRRSFRWAAKVLMADDGGRFLEGGGFVGRPAFEALTREASQ